MYSKMRPFGLGAVVEISLNSIFYFRLVHNQSGELNRGNSVLFLSRSLSCRIVLRLKQVISVLTYRFVLFRSNGFLTSYYPIGVPIVKLCKPSAGDEKSIRQVNGRMTVGVYFNVFVHFTRQ